MPDPINPSETLPSEAIAYYQLGDEVARLAGGHGELELLRTQELIQRHAPPAPAVILDVGGGPGVYACWLAQLGYEVHLVDAVPLHVEQARQASQKQPGCPIASLAVGDARHLERPGASVDVVLLLGPLYHLTEREERVAALREAGRVLRPGGVVMAAGISRFASAINGLTAGFLDDPDFLRIVHQDLEDGQHRNPTHKASYFTTAFFHHPDELRAEVQAAGLRHESSLAVEGLAWTVPDFAARWRDAGRRAGLLDLLRRLEAEPSIIGASAHIMVVARKPAATPAASSGAGTIHS